MLRSYLSDRIFMDNPSNRPTSSNPVFYRLDARNPRASTASVQPSNLFSVFSALRVRVRVRARVPFLSFLYVRI